MPGGAYGPGGKWIHDRAHRIMRDSTRGETSKSTAYAVASQQAHSLGKSPKDFRTSSGVSAARSKYPRPKLMKKTATVKLARGPELSDLQRAILGDPYAAAQAAGSVTTTLARVPRFGAPLAAASLLSQQVSPRWQLEKRASVMLINPRVDEHVGDPLGYLSALLGAQEVLDKLAVTMSTIPATATVNTTLTPLPSPTGGEGLTRISTARSSGSVNKYSKSHTAAIGPTTGLGATAKNTPPPVARM